MDNEPWISFDVNYQKDGCGYFGPGLYWLRLPEDFTAAQIERFKEKVFKFAIDQAREARKPILTYRGAR